MTGTCPPIEFRHPQAQRQARLGDAIVAYAVQRSRRRSIGLLVNDQGLSVRAPLGVTLKAIDNAVQHKADWVLNKLRQAHQRQQSQAQAQIDWQDGTVLPYLGEPLQVRLVAEAPVGGQLHPPPLETASPAALHIGLPPSASPAQIRDAVQAWLMRQAHRHFTARLEHFAPLLGVRWSRLRLSSARTRWGSAQANGTIGLNWRLLHHRPAIIDYVVAHELAHLREMNHSRLFWDTVASVVPDHPNLRRHLQEQPTPHWD